MTLRKKLSGMFIALTALTIVISIYSLINLANVNDTYTGMIDSELVIVYDTEQLNNEISKYSIFIRQYAVEPNAENLALLKEGEDALTKSIDDLKSLMKNDRISSKVDDLSTAHRDMTDVANDVIQMIQKDKMDEAYDVLNGQFRDTNIALSTTSNDILKTMKERFNDSAKTTDGKVTETIWTLSIISIVSVALSIVFMIIAKRFISAPIREIADDARRIAQGDLTSKDLQSRTNDELGQLATDFNDMKHSLKQLIETCKENTLDLSAIAEELQASTSVVANSSTTVAENVEQISHNTTEASMRSEETLQAMEQSTNAVQEIASSTGLIHDKAAHTTSLAEQGSEQLQVAQSQMTRITESAQKTNTFIGKLADQSKEIQKMAGLISEVTDQTNLLALNASIEAARAGEHGKGFAVVADEVRKLAEQSKTSTDLINSLTLGILADIQNVEQSMAEELRNVEDGTVTIDASNKAFTHIIGSFNAITDELTDISAVTEQISSATVQVSASANDLTTNLVGLAGKSENITQQVEEQVATIQEIHAVSETIAQKSMALSQVIAKFRL